MRHSDLTDVKPDGGLLWLLPELINPSMWFWNASRLSNQSRLARFLRSLDVGRRRILDRPTNRNDVGMRVTSHKRAGKSGEILKN